IGVTECISSAFVWKHTVSLSFNIKKPVMRCGLIFNSLSIIEQRLERLDIVNSLNRNRLQAPRCVITTKEGSAKSSKTCPFTAYSFSFNWIDFTPLARCPTTETSDSWNHRPYPLLEAIKTSECPVV